LSTKNGYQRGERIRLRWKGQRVTATVLVAIEGKDLVVVDDQGRLYTTYWTTEAQWHEKKSLSFRRWRRFEHGIFYLGRALEHALFGAAEIKIPTMEELQTFCREKNAEVSLLEGPILPHLQAMTSQFGKLWQFLVARKNRPLVESKTQLSLFLLLRDSLGRVNIGVLQARLATIDFRFMKELEHMCGWMPHYAARIESVRRLQLKFRQDIRQVAQSLRAMTAHAGFKTGRTTEQQTKAMAGVIRRQIQVLGELEAINPFVRWAKYCQTDLELAAQQIETGNFTQAQEEINRLLESMKLRLLGFELEELISQISLDLALGRIAQTRQDYYGKLVLLGHQIEAINETGFANPCKDVAASFIQVGRMALIDSNFTTAKTALKQAAAAI